MRLTYLLLGLLLATSLSAHAAQRASADAGTSDEAVAYQMNVAHTGSVSGDALTPPLVQRWSVDLGGTVSYPLIAGGKVFVTVGTPGISGSTLYALDEHTGQTVWSRSIGGTYSFSAAAYDAGMVFVVNADGVLQAVDAATGAADWATELPGQWAFSSPPTAADGMVYTGGAGYGGTVYAVHESDGSLAWTQSVENGDHSSPAVSSTNVYVSYTCPQVYSFTVAGAADWHYSGSCEGGGGTTPVLYGGKLYVRSLYAGYVFDATKGSLLDTFSATTAPAFAGTSRFIVNGGALDANSASTGVNLWTFGGDGSINTAPIVVNNDVYVGSSRGNLYAVNADSGAVDWQTKLPAGTTAPDEHNDVILTGLAAGEGTLVVPTGSMVTAFSSPPHGPDIATSSTQQYTLSGSDGTSWWDIDSSKLSLTLQPSTDSTAVIGGNVDLWTSDAGFNQDLGIWVSGGTYGTGSLVAWKESGGAAGTFSPNAAHVQAVLSLQAGTTYTVRLRWKANRGDSGTIWAGAGPVGGRFSPSVLSAHVISSSSATSVSAATSTQQYTLQGSDGNTWQDIDPANLALSVTPTSDVNAVLSANTDLWTSSAGYNQDVGIWVSGGAYGSGQLVGWKESGGFAGTFSPNAAYLRTAIPLQSGIQYSIKLQWKANRADPGTIWAGAGPIGGAFSPTQLAAELVPTGSTTATRVATSTQQYTLSGSDGTTWTDMDGASLKLTVTPTTDSTAVIGGNADLWTSQAGYNQDLALWIAGGMYGSGQVVAWKESGGFAGTFSPNAAYVHTALWLPAGWTYTIKLQWKAIKADTGTIWAGAGPIAGQFSPTTLTAVMTPGT